MNVSGQNSTVQNGNFLQLNERNVYEVMSILFSVLTMICVPLMLFAMIRGYEQFGSDKKHTFVNKLVSSLFWGTVQLQVYRGNLISTCYGALRQPRYRLQIGFSGSCNP